MNGNNTGFILHKHSKEVSMFQKLRRTRKGFTLVEVIVVAVIVAVLAAVAIPLYLNYVRDSRKNAAENAAGSATSFCAACINSGATLTITGALVGGGGSLTCSNNTSFAIPAKIILTVSGVASPSTVTAKHVDSPAGDVTAARSF